MAKFYFFSGGGRSCHINLPITLGLYLCVAAKLSKHLSVPPFLYSWKAAGCAKAVLKPESEEPAVLYLNAWLERDETQTPEHDKILAMIVCFESHFRLLLRQIYLYSWINYEVRVAVYIVMLPYTMPQDFSFSLRTSSSSSTIVCLWPGVKHQLSSVSTSLTIRGFGIRM